MSLPDKTSEEIPPRIASALNEADVVEENESGEPYSTSPSPPDSRVLLVETFLKEYA